MKKALDEKVRNMEINGKTKLSDYLLGPLGQMGIMTVLISSLALTVGCGTGNKKWKRYVENQEICEITVKKGDSYWRIADRLRKNSEFEDYSRGWLGQKLENYQKNPSIKRNPLNKDLRPDMKIKVPCSLIYQ